MLQIRQELYEGRSRDEAQNKARWSNFSRAWDNAVERGRGTQGVNTYISWHNMGTRMGLILGPAEIEEKRRVFQALLVLYQGQRDRNVAVSSCKGWWNWETTTSARQVNAAVSNRVDPGSEPTVKVHVAPSNLSDVDPECSLTLNDLFPLKSLLNIFDKTHRTEITGSRPDRVANKFGFRRVYWQRRASFIREEVYTATLLIDAVKAEILPEPGLTEWPMLVQKYRSQDRYTRLVQEVGEHTCYFARALEEADRLGHYPPFQLYQYLTVDEVAEHEGISREVVYQRSTVRLETAEQRDKLLSRGFQVYDAVHFAEIHLFFPLGSQGEFRRDAGQEHSPE